MATYICEIPNDENVEERIKELKLKHGYLQLWGRHPNRKLVMSQNGLKQNCNRDLPWRLGKTIVVYKRHSGMLVKDFKQLNVGGLLFVSRTPKSSGGMKGRYSAIILRIDKRRNKVLLAAKGGKKWVSRKNLFICSE
jgi:hypothetical protein